MSVPECGQRAANRGDIDGQTELVSQKSPPFETECINSRCCGCSAAFSSYLHATSGPPAIGTRHMEIWLKTQYQIECMGYCR